MFDTTITAILTDTGIVPEVRDDVVIGDTATSVITVGLTNLMIVVEAIHPLNGRLIWSIKGHTHLERSDADRCHQEAVAMFQQAAMEVSFSDY